jgi:dTDP-glucose 4,6-dehydratase
MVKKVAVTGADGFIGSHLTEALVRAGYEVRAMTLYNSFNSDGWLDSCDADVRGHFETLSGDVRDLSTCMQAVEGCEQVFHLAALIAIPYSYSAPRSYVETNVVGTLNVLEAARANGARMLHTSTSEVYGTAQFVPISEAHPLEAQSPYAASKIGADQMALSFHRSFGTDVFVCRPFNTYGPRQSARAVIPTIISQAIANRGEVQLGALTPTRDFNFVKDTAGGMIAAMDKAPAGSTINLGSDFEVSIGDLAREICELVGVEPRVTSHNRPGPRPARRK